MLRRFCHSLKNLAKKQSRVLVLLFSSLIVFNTFADPPIHDPSRTFLQMNNGTWVYLKKGNWEKNYDKVEMIYGRGQGNEQKKEIIWSKVFETDDDRAWNYAYFLRLKPGKFICDIDRDGNKEFAVATYDIGNNMFRKILIFSIRKDQIVFIREHGPYNLAADEPVLR